MNNNMSFSKQSSVPFIGTVLISQKKVTREQINEALDIQKQSHDKLGEILVKLGYCSEEDISGALSVRS